MGGSKTAILVCGVVVAAGATWYLFAQASEAQQSPPPPQEEEKEATTKATTVDQHERSIEAPLVASSKRGQGEKTDNPKSLDRKQREEKAADCTTPPPRDENLKPSSSDNKKQVETKDAPADSKTPSSTGQKSVSESAPTDSATARNGAVDVAAILKAKTSNTKNRRTKNSAVAAAQKEIKGFQAGKKKSKAKNKNKQ